MGRLGWNSGYIGSDQRDTAAGAVGYSKYYLERLDGRFNPVLGIDPDAQAFFDRVIAAGGTLSSTEQIAINQLVLDLKNYNIWTLMKAIYPMVGASSAACRQNLRSASFTGNFSSGWTFASTGVTPNGTSAFFDTTLSVSIYLNITNLHLSFYSRTDSSDSNSRVDMGRGFITGESYVNLFTKINNTTNDIGSSYGNKNLTFTNFNSACFAMSSAINNSFKLYRNGVILTSNTDISSGNLSSTGNIYIGSQGNNTGAAQFSNKQCAFASIGDGLTDTEASNLYTAVQAFQTTLSRQV